MNHTTDNTTSLSCGFAFLPISPAKISPDLRAVFSVRIAINALTCPLIILLNILVMVAVKTKRQLRTTSNVALACLATTDLLVGLVVQLLQITRAGFLLSGQGNTFCTISDISKSVTLTFLLASLHHLILMSAERYVAIKHPFAHENQVTEVRIIIASGLAWATAIIFSSEYILMTATFLKTIMAVFESLFLILPVYFNVSVYKEVRRNEKQIAANQVSPEAKEKILKNKKAFYTTTYVLLVIFLCYIPTNICVIILFTFKDRIPANVGHVAIYLVTLLPVLNSLFNPLIYAVRIRYFRVAFIQLLSRRTAAQAEELERKIFGPRQIRVIANAEQGQNRASREEDEQQDNETLNNEHATTVRTQPQEEYEETPL
ncbi:adenosine receptor A3-like [Oculina patagonica]